MADPGSPAGRRSRARSVAAKAVVAGLLVFGAAGLGTVGVVVWSKANEAPRWEEMTAAVRSLPLDAGMRAGPARRTGGACGLNPTCDVPRVLVTVDVIDDLPLTCARLLRLADAWEEQGFVADPGATPRSGPDCGTGGRLRGFGAGVVRLDDRSFVVSVVGN